MKVAGSSGRTGYTKVVTHRLSNAAAVSPIPSPISVSFCGVAEHETHDVRRAGADRDAHAEFAHSLLDRARENAEDSDHCQQKRQGRECSHEHRAEARSRCRFGGNDVDRPHARDWLPWSTRATAARTAGSSASADPVCGLTASDAMYQEF